DRRRMEAERAVLFDDAKDLLQAVELTRDPMGYPKLKGRYRGYDAVLEAIADDLSVRKVPSLWLRATIRADVPFSGSCDLPARSHNMEFYPPANDFDHAVRLPAGWPDHLTVKSDDPTHMPPQSLLTPHVRCFDDPRMKEVLVTPWGVRLVRQGAQAARAE